MTGSGTRGEAPLWTPSEEAIKSARMTRFMEWASERHQRSFEDYCELWQWSVDELEQFWADVWELCGVRASKPYEQVLASRRMPGAKWFEGAELNYAENLLCRDRDPAATAIVASSELRPCEELSWSELSSRVAAVAAGLRSLGVSPGDRVAAYMPNIPETLIAFLACASIGAIWSSAAPEFGARSVVDRFAQIEPKVLLAVDGYRHGGRDFDRKEQLASILEGLPTVRRTVLLGYLNPEADPAELPGGMSWRELMGSGEGADGEGADGEDADGEDAVGNGPSLRFEQLPFDHPLLVLYSSGTTGLPKAIVHGHGGILVEQLKKSQLHLDLKPGDRMFWFTTTGWMMWNFLIGCLFADAAIVLYDGSPSHPGLDALWALAERTKMTCMGLSAGLIGAYEKAGLRPSERFDLAALKAIGSTGSPLSPEGFKWVYEHVKRDVWLFSTSGGTDVCTAFLGGCPLSPVYEGELQCRVLGCKVESFDEQGKSLIEEVGELVLTEPMPSMPLCLWDDPTGERYRDSYFSTYPGIWRHGDWVKITSRGGAVIYGRSDSTINRQGVRMGTSEIYRATSSVEEVVDALVVDVPRPAAGAGDDRGGVGTEAVDRRAGDGAPSSAGEELSMMLFVVLKQGASLNDDLRAKIKRRIREDCSPRHVPNEILQIAEVPRTLSGKALEVPVKRILMGASPQQAASRESLANPASLGYFEELAAKLRGHP